MLPFPLAIHTAHRRQIMEMTSLIDVLIGLVVTGLAWFLSEQNKETKRLGILINKTREDYATRIAALENV
jgi:uncharacterized membrane protein YccC